MPENLDATLNPNGSVTVSFDINCNYNGTCDNGVLYFIAFYGQESEADTGLTAEYGVGTYIAPNCNKTAMWDGSPARGHMRKHTTCTDLVFGQEANVLKAGYEQAFDKATRCNNGQTSMSTTFAASQFCEGVTYDVRIWEILVPVAPNGDITNTDIACLTDILDESAYNEIIGVLTYPGIITQIPAPEFHVSGAVNGSFSGCNNLIELDCDDEVTIDLTATGGCVSNTMLGYYLFDVDFDCDTINGFPDISELLGGADIIEWDFLFGDRLYDNEGNLTPVNYRGGVNPLANVSFKEDTRVCIFVQDWCNGSWEVSCIEVDVPVPPLVVVDDGKHQGGCAPDSNYFNLNIAGGSGGPYTYTYDNGEGNSGSGTPGTVTNLGTDGGIFDIVIYDNGTPKPACPIEYQLTFERILTPFIIPSPVIATACEGDDVSITLSMHKELITTHNLKDTTDDQFIRDCINGTQPRYSYYAFDYSNINNPDGSNEFCDATTQAYTLENLNLDITVHPTSDSRLWALLLFNPASADEELLYVGQYLSYSGTAGTQGKLPGGNYSFNYSAGTTSYSFDGTFDGNSDLGVWTGDPDPESWYVVSINYDCYLGADSIQLNQGRLNVQDKCSQIFDVEFGTPEATWTPDAGNPAPPLTYNVGGNNGDFARFYSSSATNGNIYNYDIQAYDPIGCPTDAKVSVEILDALANPTSFEVDSAYCNTIETDTITPTNLTSESNRSGLFIAIKTDNNGTNHNTFDLYDRAGNLMMDETNFGSLANNTVYVLYDNPCFDTSSTVNIPSRLVLHDTEGDGLFDFNTDNTGTGAGVYIYYYGPDVMEYAARDLGANGFGSNGLEIEMIGTEHTNFPIAYTASTIINTNNITNATSTEYSIASPNQFHYINIGSWDSEVVSNLDSTTYSYFSGTNSERIISVPSGYGLLNTDGLAPRCSEDSVELLYNYQTNQAATGPGTSCSCDDVALDHIAINESVQIDSISELDCSSNGTIVYQIHAHSISGTTSNFEMSEDKVTWEALGAIPVAFSDGSKQIFVRAADGCSENQCIDSVLLVASLPIPTISAISDDKCEGGAPPYTVTISNYSVNCSNCLVEFSFNGGPFSTVDTFAGVGEGETVVIEARTQQNGNYNTCSNPNLTYTPGDCPKAYTTPSSVLPVLLMNFEGSISGEKHQISWQVAQEINLAYYTLYHSVDGLQFEEIYSTDALAKDLNSMTYYFDHEIKSSGQHYYRLVAVDVDGSSTTSSIIELNRPPTDTFELVQIVPNPFGATMRITAHVPDSSFLLVTLQNADGATIQSWHVNAENLSSTTFEVNHISAGNYFVTITDGIRFDTKKVVKY